MKNKILSYYIWAWLPIALMQVQLSAAPIPLKTGDWKATIQRPDGRQLVFVFEVKDSAARKIIIIKNAGERLKVDDIKMSGDSLAIEMPFFESRFRVKLSNENQLDGFWIKSLATAEQRMPFTAVFNKQRFDIVAPPIIDISGRWSVAFSTRDRKVTWAVGEFVQQGNRLTGTFLTASGDYRFLEGIMSGDSMKLSTFDGSHAYVFTARAHSDTLLSGGYFFAGYAGLEKWTARKDPAASLPDGYSETRLKPGAPSLNFRFKDTRGKMVSILDAKYRNKVVIVQITGSWCPNCMDETAFLSTYYNESRPKNVEIIALAYELTTDFKRSQASIAKFQKRFDMKYPVLITGVAVSDSLRTEKTLPQLTDIVAFPTSIYIDKKGAVRKIYSGFTGPGTGAHYEQFKTEFRQTIETLSSE